MNFPKLTLPQLLDRTVARFPRNAALIYCDQQLSYAELHEHVQRAAAGLQALRVQPGDRVALMMVNCPQSVIAFYATLRVGGVVTATCPIYTPHEARYQWHDAGAKVVIADTTLQPVIEAVRTQVATLQHVVFTDAQDYAPKEFGAWHTTLGTGTRLSATTDQPITWRDLLQAGSQPTPVTVTPRDLACLQYTGGTTGISKGAMLTHTNLVANAFQTIERTMRDGQPEIILGVLPFFHIFAVTCVLTQAIATGSTIVLLPRFELAPALDALRKHRPTMFFGVPTMYVAFVCNPQANADDFRSLRGCISGGAPLPSELVPKFQRLLTFGRLGEGYGLSETSPVTHMADLSGEIRAGSIGRAVQGTDARIVDTETGTRELPDGEPGELVVRGPQVMRGYWNKPEESARVLRDGWFHTGDIAIRDQDGFFSIVDRKKDLIIVGGCNVYPREVEEVLFKHPHIQEAMVIGVPDPYRGETVKAFVVPQPGQEIDAEQVVAFCREHLAGYKVPRFVESRTALPKSGVGKYLRRELRREETEARAATPTAAIRV